MRFAYGEYILLAQSKGLRNSNVINIRTFQFRLAQNNLKVKGH